MSSMHAAAPGPPPDPAVGPLTALDELVATLDQIGRLTAHAVQLAGDAAAADAAEQRTEDFSDFLWTAALRGPVLSHPSGSVVGT